MNFDVHDLIFTHYTSDIKETKFDESLKPKEHSLRFKPSGLWGSPQDTDTVKFFRWIDWLENEGYEEDAGGAFGHKYHFDFKLKDDADILVVSDMEGINKCRKFWHNLSYVVMDIHPDLYYYYDGIFLYHGDNYSLIHYSEFNGWDVDSIVVWNYSKIVPI